MPEEPTRRVYSTDGTHAERTRPARTGVSARRNSDRPTSPFPDDGFVRIRREKSGRGGKTVTVVYGLTGSQPELDDLLKALKQRCGAGGTREGASIEIQGDHRDRVETELSARGFRVKQAGG